MNTKHIAELVRNLASTYDSSYPEGRNQRHDSLMEIANELDPPEPRPLLADAEVGWVCRLKNGKWVQLTKTDRDVIHNGESYPYEYVLGERGYVNVNGYWNISTGPHPADIVSCEPLATEGSAEWAWQMMLLGEILTLDYDFIYKVVNGAEYEMRRSGDGEWHLCWTSKDKFLKDVHETGWQLYEPKPEPLLSDAKVGDICKRRDGKWVQIVALHNELPYPITCSDGYTRQYNGAVGAYSGLPRDIIHTEPLAPEGTAEWALQQMKLGKTVCHPIDDKPHRCRITDDKIVCDYCGQVFDIAKWTSGCLQQSSWCIYEPAKPEPAPFRVGDWVTDGVVTGKIIGCGMGIAYVMRDDKGYPLDFANLRKLSTSEVRVKITLEGTVKPCSVNTFELCTNEGSYWIGWKELDPDTAKLVRELVGKEADK